MKHRKCPRCRKEPVEYIELWKNHSISFNVDDLGMLEEEGYMEPGSPYSVEAKCVCGFQWRLRNVSMIADLRDPQQRCR